MPQALPKRVRPASEVRALACAILGVTCLVAAVVGAIAGEGGAAAAGFGVLLGVVFFVPLGLLQARGLRPPPDPTGRIVPLPDGVPFETRRQTVISIVKFALLFLPFLVLGTAVNGAGIPGFVLGMLASGYVMGRRVDRWERRHGVRLLQPIGTPLWDWRKPYAYVEATNR